MVNELRNNSNLKKIDALLKPYGFSCIDYREHKNSINSWTFSIYLVRDDKNEITTEDLEQSYGVLYPFFQELSKSKNVSLEVSSPGVERKIKDAYEFAFFVGKNARVYDENKSLWVYGTIKSSDEKSVTLTNAFNENEREISEEVVINFDDIKKSNLLLELLR